MEHFQISKKNKKTSSCFLLAWGIMVLKGVLPEMGQAAPPE